MKVWSVFAITGLSVALLVGCDDDGGSAAGSDTTEGTATQGDASEGGVETEDGEEGADGTPTEGDDPEGGATSGLTYYADAKPVVDARCATCHSPGEIGPFPLTNYEEVKAFAGAMRASIESGTMPPWQPSDTCNTYLHNIDLTPDERELMLTWLDDGAPEGDPADAPAEPINSEFTDFVADYSLQLPEPYAPTKEPDDYRCQLIEWPADETRYVTGLRVTPDQASIVHHVIVFLATPDQVDQFIGYDEGEDGPGYTCYGGPTASTSEGGLAGALANVDPAELFAALQEAGLTLEDIQNGNASMEQIAALLSDLDIDAGGSGFRTLGSWVPGVPAAPLPPGTGLRVEPGSMLVAQFHYNTLSSDPVADQSVIEIATTDSVEKEATNLPLVDFGWVTDGMVGDPMTIPAGEENVEHSTILPFNSPFLAGARDTLGLEPDAPLVIYSANHHMHTLGRTQRTELRRADGDTECLLDIPDWDFAWQGSYQLAEPIVIRPGDELWMGCSWDNSAANQPIIDGELKEPADVHWGEGTTDEMCLGSLYVTGE